MLLELNLQNGIASHIVVFSHPQFILPMAS